MKLHNLKKSDWVFLFISIILYMTGAVIVYGRGLVFCADSVGYMNYYTSQPPVYPMVIKICALLSGTSYGPFLLVVQILAGLTVIAIFSHFLYRTFSVNRWVVLLLSFILFEPYFWGLRIGNNMATESMAYPLFLISVKYLIEAIKLVSTRKFILAFVFISLLILTRAQFFFFYILIPVIIIYLFLFKKLDIRGTMKLILIFAGFVAGLFLFEKTYHYIRSGTMSRPTGTQLFVNAVYVSRAQDSTLFTDRTERQIFSEIMKTAEQHQLTRYSTDNANNAHYFISYTRIMMVVMETFHDHFVHETAADSIAAGNEYNFRYLKDTKLMVQMGTMSKSMSKKLMARHWKDYLQLYVKSILYALDYPIEVTRKLLMALALVILFIAGSRKFELTVVILAVLCHLLNLGLVASVEHILARYSFYTDILVYVIIASVLLSWLGQKTELVKTGNEK